MPEIDLHADLVYWAVQKPPFADNVTHAIDPQYGKPKPERIGDHRPDILASEHDRLIIGEAMTIEDLDSESFHEKLSDFSQHLVDNERVAFFLIAPYDLRQAAHQAIDDHGERHSKVRVITIQ